jgi:hypothetical protein
VRADFHHVFGGDDVRQHGERDVGA